MVVLPRRMIKLGLGLRFEEDKPKKKTKKEEKPEIDVNIPEIPGIRDFHALGKVKPTSPYHTIIPDHIKKLWRNIWNAQKKNWKSKWPNIYTDASIINDWMEGK